MQDPNPNPQPDGPDGPATPGERAALALAQALAALMSWAHGPQGTPQGVTPEGPQDAQDGPEAQDAQPDAEDAEDAQPEPSAPRGPCYQSHAEPSRVALALTRDPFDGPRVEIYREPVAALAVDAGTARVLGLAPGDPLAATLYAAGASWEPSRHAWRLPASDLPPVFDPQGRTAPSGPAAPTTPEDVRAALAAQDAAGGAL